MTLETLVRIIIEAVEKAVEAERLKVLGLCFDKSNTERLKEAVVSLNERGTVSYLPDFPLDSDCLPDVLYLDYIPIEYVPEIALGLTRNMFSKYISRMIFEGKQITVLGYGPVIPKTTPPGYSALLSSYYKMIESYGVNFLRVNKDGKQKPYPKSQKNVYTGNVLSKRELLEYAENGEIVIGKSVIVTDLARDEGKLRNIKINRL